MDNQEFKKLFLKALYDAAFHAERRFNRQISRSFEIELHGAGYVGSRITPEAAADILFIDNEHFYRIIDVAVIEIQATKTCVFVRVSGHEPGVFIETWNQPPGMGPFKQINAKEVQVFYGLETSSEAGVETLTDTSEEEKYPTAVPVTLADRQIISKADPEALSDRSEEEKYTTTASVTLADSLPVIVASLKQVQYEGQPIENFVIFFADIQRNYYIQVAPESDASPYSPNVDEYSLYAEAVGNEVLDSRFRLDTAQIEKLSEFGWKESPFAPNYYQTWHAETDDERSHIAQTIIGTFVDVYGFLPDQRLGVQMVIPNI